jgi:hypothetical protein
VLVYVNGSLLTSLTILRERLDLCCLDSSTSYPDCTLDYDCGNHSKDGCRRKICNFVLATRKKLLDGFLQDLQKRDNHENREDQDTKRFKAAPAHGELLPQTSESPTYELVQRRSSAESTKDAMRESELDQIAATPLAPSKRMLTITLTCSFLAARTVSLSFFHHSH